MKRNNKEPGSVPTKIIIAWIFLILLLGCLLVLNYVKFFMAPNPNILEYPVEKSSSEAIGIVLNEIADNFNTSGQLQEYLSDKIELKATVNQNSLFISYVDVEMTTTFEFSYSNLFLSITIENNSENVEKFNKVLEVLIRATQKRIGNEANLNSIINNILNETKEYDGIYEEKGEDRIQWKIDITKKLQDKNS